MPDNTVSLPTILCHACRRCTAGDMRRPLRPTVCLALRCMWRRQQTAMCTVGMAPFGPHTRARAGAGDMRRPLGPTSLPGTAVHVATSATCSVPHALLALSAAACRTGSEEAPLPWLVVYEQRRAQEAGERRQDRRRGQRQGEPWDVTNFNLYPSMPGLPLP